MAGSEHPGRKIRIWLTDRFGEMRLAGMGTEYAFTEAASGHLTAFLFDVRMVADRPPARGCIVSG